MMDVNKLVHQPTRLQIFAHLYQHGRTSFQDLTDALEVTEGNLASHTSKMEDAGALSVEKEFVDKKPQTSYELTDEGRTLFEDHVQTLEALIDQVESGEE